MVQIRIGFVGDSITHGTGDETLLGWTYRVGQTEAAKGHDVTVYNLGIRADTSALVEARWEVCAPTTTTCLLELTMRRRGQEMR